MRDGPGGGNDVVKPDAAKPRDNRPDHPAVLMPPPILWLLFLGAGLGLDWLLPLPFRPAGVPAWIGWGVFALGILAGLLAALTFHRAGTNVPPHRPALCVVTHGPYRFSRNPIYLALLLCMVGVAVAVDSLWLLALLPLLWALLHWGVVLREERYLAAKFGDPYRAYCTRVRRWL